jgi:hypothetical protein
MRVAVGEGGFSFEGFSSESGFVGIEIRGQVFARVTGLRPSVARALGEALIRIADDARDLAERDKERRGHGYAG